MVKPRVLWAGELYAGDNVNMSRTFLIFLLASVLASTVPDETLKIDSDFINALQNRKYSRTGSASHFVGHHPVLQQKFFVKTHRKGEDAAVRLELKALQMLRDVGYVPKGYGGVTHKYLFHLVMEHVSSFNLGKLKNQVFLQKIYPHAAFYLSQILQALEMVNRAGLLYLDMKDENVLIDRTGLIVLADFGGCATPEEVANNQFSRFCTPFYAAPEVLVEHDLRALRTCASEWWSFGVLCYVFFKGELPFMANTIDDLTDKVLDMSPDTKGLTAEETILVNGLIERNIKDRLGYHSGIDRLKGLAYFTGIDWNKVCSRNLVVPLHFEESYYTH